MEPYGSLWPDHYAPVALEFGLTIAAVSNVGTVDAGAWAGWRCLGNSMVVGPAGAPVHISADGVDAARLDLVDLPGLV